MVPLPFESFGTVSYSHSIVTMAAALGISEIFSVMEWPDREVWVWGRSRSLPFERPLYDFLLVGHCNYSSILYHFRVLTLNHIVTLISGLEVTRGH